MLWKTAGRSPDDECGAVEPELMEHFVLVGGICRSTHPTIEDAVRRHRRRWRRSQDWNRGCLIPYLLGNGLALAAGRVMHAGQGVSGY